MIIQRVKLIGATALWLSSFLVCADDTYEPATYQPSVQYGASMHSDRVDVVPEKSNKPKLMPEMSASKAVEPTTSSIAVEPHEASGVKNDDSTINNYLFLGLLAIVGFFWFRRKQILRSPVTNSSDFLVTKSVGLTGVERYIEKNQPQKTAVAKYLERQAGRETITGVAKYLIKQKIESR